MPSTNSKPKNSKNKIEPTAWMPHREGEPEDGGEEITVPSGQTCRVLVSMGIQGLVSAGVIDQLDSLSALVESDVVAPRRSKKKAAGPTESKQDKDRAEAVALMKDPKKLAQAFAMINDVVCHVVIDPPVAPVPVEDPTTGLTPAREVGTVYVDKLMDVDKMFIFNHAVAGVRNLETFRAQLEEVVDGMDDSEAVASSAE